MFMASGLTRWGSVPAVVLLMGNPALAAARVVFVESEVDAPIETVFEAWSAQLGGEGASILAREANSLLSVQWAVPSSLSGISAQRTVLTLTFERRADDQTVVTLTHAGFGKGEEWDEALAFFAQGWPHVAGEMKAAIETAQTTH